MKLTGIIFILLCSTTLAYGQKFSKGDVDNDFKDLYRTLQETHYNLYAYKDKLQYDSLYNVLQSSIKADSLSLLETVSFYQHLVSFANTGHCEIDFPAGPYIEYLKSGGTVFPLELSFENNKTFIRKNFSSIQHSIIGDELISIDDIPISSIEKDIFPLISAERAYFKRAKIEFWSFPRIYFQQYGKKNHWQLKIKDKKGQIKILKVHAIPAMEYEEKRGGEIVNPKRSVVFYKNTAYLNPGMLNSSEPEGFETYRNYIDSAFEKIKNHRSQSLIIDLRNNPGGDDAYSDYFISYFAKKPFRWYSKFSVKTSKVLKEHIRKQTDTTDSFSQQLLTNRDGHIIPIDFPLSQPVNEAKIFKGHVYVLVNRQTYSMAAVSAALIQDYQFGTIAGEETGDTPTLYASQFSFHLPRTGITVKVPKGYIIRPNGDEALQGVIPDIIIRDHLLDENDEILKGLLIRINK